MDQETSIKFSLLSIGSLLVAASFTWVGLYAFQKVLPGVVTGFLLFVAGYKICWYGAHHEGSLNDLKAVVLEVSRESFNELFSKPSNYILILIGVTCASYGTLLFAEIIISFKFPQAILSGIFSSLGYVLAHEGVNEVPI